MLLALEVEAPSGPRPAVILTRDAAIPLLANVVVAGITRTVRGIPTEVPVGPEHGLASESVVNCDDLFTLPKRTLGRRRGELDTVGSPVQQAGMHSGIS